MVDEKTIKEYAADMAMYYESAHGFVPAQFEKYLRNAVIKGEELAIRKGMELAAKQNEEMVLSFLERIAELEKGNTELVAEVKHYQSTSTNWHFRCKALDENLVIAKSLIRRLIDSCCAYGATGRTTADAEQFLREAM